MSEELGGPPIPGVGFGLGIERLLITMEAAGKEIPVSQGANAFIVFMGESARKEGMALMRSLRKARFRVEMDMLARNVKNQFKCADRAGAKRTIVVGEDEISKKVVSMKNMETGTQETIPFDKIISYLEEK